MIGNNAYMVHALGIAVRITVLVLLLAGSAQAATLTVCKSGCAYSRIQTAINDASIGDTILVQSGTYYENVNVTKQLNLRGIGMPVVDAKGSGSAITLFTNGVILEGFTAIGSEPSFQEAGIKIISNNNMLKGNNVSNNSIGVSLYYSSNNNIYNNFFNNINNINLNNNDYSNIININIWNTTRTSDTNIIGGPYLGGNFWANPGSIGFSQTCKDADNDGICDSPYTLGSANIDHLPLAYKPLNILKGDLNNNGVPADANDLVLMKRASIAEINL